MELINIIYVLGYNKFSEFESKIILEKDIYLIKNAISNISYSRLDNTSLEVLRKYDDVLANIVIVLQQVNKNRKVECIYEIFLNSLVFIYLKPEVINYDYDFLYYVYDYLSAHAIEFINFTGYKGVNIFNFGDSFINNFNYANNLLLKLYEEKRNNVPVQKLIKEKY